MMTVIAMVLVMLIATGFGVYAIRHQGISNAHQSMRLLCRAGEKNLDSYFESVEQSVAMVSAYVEKDLTGLEDEELQAHLDRVSDIFQRMTYKTNGILTYYYRIDPQVSMTAKGFWFVNQGDEGFREHEVTDITRYDTNDTSQLVWFTVPKATGKPVWLPPYITDNLGARVISYNVPVYLKGRFVGVIGIEIDYTTMAEQVDHITLYDDGYAFINDAKGKIIYHPRISVEELTKKQPKVPAGLLSKDQFVRYTYRGVDREAVWLPLSNGMRLNVTVPVEEIEAGWTKWVEKIIIIFGILLLLYVILIMRFTGHITRPLRQLTGIAERVNGGEYEFDMDYKGDDEVGVLARAFEKLISHLKVYISDLNDLAYADALTSVHNKGAFDIYVRELEARFRTETPEFAVCMFDCNDLKAINDRYGHQKGDEYLKNASKLICEVFSHSPVFRIGGDEFATFLLNGDYENREELARIFAESCGRKGNAGAAEDAAGPASEADIAVARPDVAWGMAVYDPEKDDSVEDVIVRADILMYANKRERKEGIR